MVTSVKQVEANQRNALLSTGPRTHIGKHAASRNALKHGILSRQLILDDESREDFQILMDELARTLDPQGALEFALVEKIAIALWRQRRLIRAETATIESERRPELVLEEVREKLGGKAVSWLTEEEIAKDEEEHAWWCNEVLAELAKCKPSNVSDLSKEAPLAAEFALQRAEEGQSLQQYLSEFGGVEKYLKKLSTYCKVQLRKEETRSLARTLVEQSLDSKSIPEEGKLALFSRYQVMLDNELYKAVQALRKTQASKSKVIDASE